MNLILLSSEDFIDQQTVRLTGRRFAHIVSVLGAETGQQLKVGLLNGPMGHGTIIAINAESVTLQVKLDQPSPAPAQIRLMLALPRPKVLKRVLQGVTAMGVKQIILFSSWRVDKSYWQSPLLHKEKISEQLLLGLEQGRDTMLPEVLTFHRFKPFVEDHLPELLGKDTAWLAHPEAAQNCPANTPEPGVLIIGPEGGFIQYEIDRLVETGCIPVRFGPRPLRVETAVPALLGRLLPL